MSGLKNMSITDGPVISVTGGTAQSYVEDGVSIQNGIHLVNSTDSNYADRRQMTIKNRPPALDPKTRTYGKDKKSISIARPYYVNGGTVFCTIRIEREIHPDAGSEVAESLNETAAQLLVSPDLDAFWKFGSLS